MHAFMGQYRVAGGVTSAITRDGGDMAFRGRPKGRITAIWVITKYDYRKKKGEEGRYSKTYYYAASLKGDVMQLPPRHRHHWEYEGFIFTGRPRGRIAHESDDLASFYYFYRSRLQPNKGAQAVDTGYRWRDDQQWHRIQGIEITQAQFDAMHDCDITSLKGSLPAHCRPFLNENTPGITPAQRAYIQAHPYGDEDIKPFTDYIGSHPGNPWK